MYIRSFAVLSLLAAAQAVPPPKILSFDDVIVPNNDGSYSIMKDYEYGIQESKRDMLYNRAKHSAPTIPPGSLSLVDRRCDEANEVQVLTDSTFTNWDVAMSPVISNTGSSNAIVAVTKGYSVANGISITASAGWTIIPEVLKLSFSISTSETWTTQDTQTFQFFVPEGQNGVVVSQPLVRRLTGNLVTGCMDSPAYEPFTADSYSDQNYNGMSWVRGPILLCNSTDYPIPYCNGNGVHK